jgi:hypothetical protein
MVELDRWLPNHVDDLKLQARDKDDGIVEVRDLPITVQLPAAAVVNADEPTLRTMIVNEMGRQLYDNGTSAFRENDGSTASLGVTEPVRWAVTLLNSSMHRVWLAVMALTLLLALAAAASVMTTGHPPVNAIAIGAILGGILCVAFWGLTQFIEGSAGSAADREIVLILRDGGIMGLRNCGGVAFAGVVLAVLLNFSRSRESRGGYHPEPHTNWS